MQIDPRRDISGVILTHLHHDQTGGLDHFPHTPIIVPRACWDAYSGFRGTMMGCLPQRWPIWLKPPLIEINGPREGSFASSLTRSLRTNASFSFPHPDMRSEMPLWSSAPKV